MTTVKRSFYIFVDHRSMNYRGRSFYLLKMGPLTPPKEFGAWRDRGLMALRNIGPVWRLRENVKCTQWEMIFKRYFKTQTSHISNVWKNQYFILSNFDPQYFSKWISRLFLNAFNKMRDWKNDEINCVCI